MTEFTLKLNKTEDVKKIELYNLKNLECQEKFKACTSNTKMLSSVFDSKEDLDILTDRFLKKLDGCIARSFRKIRMSKREDKGVTLYDEMAKLKSKTDETSKARLEEVLEKLADDAKKMNGMG